MRAALRAGAVIVPVAIMGAEEALPVLARLPRLPLVPPLLLPAKFRIRFLEPVASDNRVPGSRKAKLDRLYEAVDKALRHLSEGVGIPA